MFSGIIKELGTIIAICTQGDGKRFEISAPHLASSLSIGDSVSVSGCCLTVTSLTSQTFCANVVPETLARTNLGALTPQDQVNLEGALAYGMPVGGHLVQGHVDELGAIKEYALLNDASRWVTISLPDSLLRYCAVKGSIAVDGVSLTIAKKQEDGFSFAMIPHTAAHTTLGRKKIGDLVNIEVDILAKYVQTWASPYIK